MEQNEFFYEIRWARKEDWNQTVEMIWETFLKFEGKDYSEEGIRGFREFLTDGTLYNMFLNGEYPLAVAVMNQKMIGAGSLRNGNFLSLLFVEESYQKKGVGRALLASLCDYLKTEAGEKFIHLAAAPSAIGFYEKLGFRKTAEEQHVAGIRVTPMRRDL